MSAPAVDLATIEAAHPQLRPEVILGGPRRRGEQVVHYLRDPEGSGSHCVGDREFFLISRLDGQRTLGEIGQDYHATYGRRLGVAHWQHLLALLAHRGLLQGGARPSPNGAVATSLTGRRPANRLYYRRFPLLNPDRFF